MLTKQKIPKQSFCLKSITLVSITVALAFLRDNYIYIDKERVG